MTARPEDIRLSVVTVTKNAAPYIAACIDSVVRQRHPNVEHVIIDGASTDGTVEIARSKLRKSDTLVSEPDRGIYEAMNRGIDRATGDYLLFLGGDDWLFDERVAEDAAAFLHAEGQPGMIYGDIEVRGDNGQRSVFRPPEPEHALDLMICGCLPHQATFAHRSVFSGAVGKFNEAYSIHGDYDWFLRVLVAPDVKVRHFKRTITSFSTAGASTSRLELGQREAYAIQNAFPLYQQPEWMGKRMREFQQQVLSLRLQAAAASEPSLSVSRLKRAGKRLMGKLSAIGGAGRR